MYVLCSLLLSNAIFLWGAAYPLFLINLGLTIYSLYLYSLVVSKSLVPSHVLLCGGDTDSQKSTTSAAETVETDPAQGSSAVEVETPSPAAEEGTTSQEVTQEKPSSAGVPDFSDLEVDTKFAEASEKHGQAGQFFFPSSSAEMLKRGLVNVNVKNFPLVYIAVYGFGTLIVDFAVIVSNLTRTTRRKLAALCNKKTTDAAEIRAIVQESGTPAKDTVTASAVTPSDSIPEGPSGTALTANDKKLVLLLKLLGLPVNISNSQLKWVFSSRHWTAENKKSLNAHYLTYKNSPKGK